jgi:CBS domain-containing protein
MTVEAHCNHNVATIPATKGITDAAKMKRELHVGDLLVTDKDSRLLGIVTDRDIVVELVAKDVDYKAVTVGDIMTTDVATVKKDNGLEFALGVMQREGIRRIPVVTSHGELVGLLSLDDVVDYVAELLVRMGRSLKAELAHEVRERP